MRALASLLGVLAALACAPGVADADTRPGTLSVFAGVIGTPDSVLGRLPAVGPATAAYLTDPAGVAVDQAGDVYVADAGSSVVVKVTPAGELSIVAGTGQAGEPTPGPATTSDLRNPNGLAVDAAGNLYIDDLGNDVIEKVTPTGELSIVAGTGQAGEPTPGPATMSDLDRPLSIAVSATGVLYIADRLNDEVEEVTPNGILAILAGTGRYGEPTPGPATRSRLDGPDGLAVDDSGDVYIADVGASILKVTPSGTLSIVAGARNRSGGPTPGPATRSLLGGPLGMAVDASGDLYVADFANNCVEEVTPSGVLSVIAGTGATPPRGTDQLILNNLLSPQDLAIGPNGSLYIASTDSRIVEDMADVASAESLGQPTTAVAYPRTHDTEITETLSCLSGASPCTVAATLTTEINGRREITLSRRKLTIAVGRFETVTLTPNQTGKLLLRKLLTLPVVLTIRANRTTLFRGALTLKQDAA